MLCRISSFNRPGVEFLPAQALSGDGIGVGAPYPSGLDGFVGIDRDFVFCCRFQDFAVVVNHPLSVVVFSFRNKWSDIACFDRMDPAGSH